MNLSSTMYRLNVQQQQTNESPQTSSSSSSSSSNTAQAIPSHILLQQQLAAAAAAAAVSGAGVSVVQPATTAIALHVGELNGGNQTRTAAPTPATPGSTIAIVGANAAHLLPLSNVVATTASVEEKIKIISTAMKAEQRDVIALTTSALGKSSASSSGKSKHHKQQPPPHMNNISNSISNNNHSSNSSNSGNIIALTINSAPTATVTAAGAAPSSSSSSIKLVPGPSTSAAAAAAAAVGQPTAIAVQHLNAVNSINLVVGGGASGSNAAAGALVITAAPAASTAPSSTGSAPSVSGTSASSSSATTANGHLVFVPSKRARLEGPNEEWLSTTPSPGSVPSTAPPLSPSPGSQHHSYSANMSNGYASPMSAGSYDPYSPNGKTGRDDLSPSSSLNGYSANESCDVKKIKKGPAPRLQEELCLVCGDRASGYHYNALTCEGCKGFFRRSVTKNAVYCCKFGRACEMDMYMRRKCQECRLKKCLAVGMRPECVVPENQCAMKRREKKAQKEKDKQQASPLVSTSECIKKEILELMACDPPSHATCPILPEDIVEKCRARNIMPLTSNQLAVIYKLIWYQDGYEQPSEEDLKRIMSAPDENESQHDISFRHITEITILTVQLIVEFAKGLPAFTKIPQEDQITLLKACSSEVMMLRMARRYDPNTDSIFFANNRSYTRDAYKMAGVADNIEDLLHFCRQMYSMKVDNVEYALLTAIVIFSDRPGLEEAELVEAIQRYYIDTLRIYILNRHCGDQKSLVFFAKLLSILTELRTLGNQNAEMCFSLKLKNRKLPKFLEEIWDVDAVPPVVKSHIQATQAERESAEAIASVSASSSAPSPSTSAAAIDASYSGSPSSTPSVSLLPGVGLGVGVSVNAVNTGLNGGIATAVTDYVGGAVTPNLSMMTVPLKQEHMMSVQQLKQEHMIGVQQLKQEHLIGVHQLKQEHMLGGDANTAA